VNKKAKKLLLGANIALLVVVCVLAAKAFNGRASTIAVQKMTKVCTNIVDQVRAGTMSLDQAGAYAAKQTSAGKYTPTVRVIRQSNDFLLETNDPSFKVNVLTIKADEFYVVNCSQLATS
jgi:hypothetical protein